MLQISCKNDLLCFLRGKQKRINAVVMPDFFCDRLINIDCDITRFSSLIADVATRKGGSLDEIAQMEIRGGNAVNTASALAALGMKVIPIVCTSKFGLQMIRAYLEKYHIDFSHIKIADKISLTTALELKTKTGRVNVMLRDVGSLEHFGPSNLNEHDYELIDNANYVCLFNWAGTKRFGTALAETIFSRVKTIGKGKTYYDPADPMPNKDIIAELLRRVLKKNYIDILSVNENEAIYYATMLDNEFYRNSEKNHSDELTVEAARVLARHLSARIDIHTKAFSASFTKKTEVIVPAFKVKALRATGAGDAWNAGNILGDGNNLSDECRLALANAVSACYLTDLSGTHPTLRKLIKFVKTSALKGQVL